MNKILRSLLLAGTVGMATTAFANKQTVTVQNYQFTPSTFTICMGDTVVFNWVNGSHTTTSTSVPTGAASWNTPMTSTSTTFTYVPSVAGSYSFKCTPHAASGMTGSFTVNALPTQPVITPAGGSVCPGTPLTLSTTAVSGETYQWFLSTTLVSGTATAATFSATQPGSYTVNAINGCGTATSTAVTVTTGSGPAQPVVDVPSTGTSACQGNSVVLHTSTNGSATHQWMLNGSDITTNGTGDTYNANQTGTYTVRDSNACGTNTSASVSVIINVPATPVINVSGSGATYTFSTSTIGVAYDWDFGDGSAHATVQNPPAHTYATSGTFGVMLTITDTNGCDGMSMQSVQSSLGIATVIGNTEYQLMPNPASTTLLLQNGANTTVTLLDNAGRKVSGMQTTASGNNLSLNVTNVPTGIYTLQVITTNGNGTLRLMVKH